MLLKQCGTDLKKQAEKLITNKTVQFSALLQNNSIGIRAEISNCWFVDRWDV